MGKLLEQTLKNNLLQLKEKKKQARSSTRRGQAYHIMFQVIP